MVLPSIEPVLPDAKVGPENERRALGVVAALAIAAMVWVTHTVLFGILLGALNAFMMQSLYERLRARGHRSAMAAGTTVLTSALGVLGAASAFSYLLLGRGVPMASALLDALGPGGAGQRFLDRSTHRLQPLGIHAADVSAKLRDAAAEIAARAAALTAAIASATFEALLTLFFALMTTYFVLRHWQAITRRMEDMLPLHPRHTRALLEELRRVGRTTLLGTLLTGAAQGTLAGVGYWIAGLPEPGFFGAATAVASLVPAIGTLLVWVPAGIYLIASGHPTGGVFELVWGTLFVVGVSDYVIRPRLVGGQSDMPVLLTFAALFGGVEALGLSGLLIGPLVMAVALATLRIYAAETAGRHTRITADAPD